MNTLRSVFDYNNKKSELDTLTKITHDPSFWQDKDKANEIINKINSLKSCVEEIDKCEDDINDNLSIINELAEAYEEELVSIILENSQNISNRIENLHIQTFLNGKYDANNCLMEIHSGAGGTEACDWVNMLYRMYTRYFNKIGYTSTLLYASLGEETGYKSITLQIKGDHAYGYLKKESGIHRLVRISPFDSSKRRHTSFASVEVIPEIEDDIDIAIPETDLKIDIYRSSGPGGQGVNTTDSAVRITHIPTGIVVTCQNERSQIQNKAMCLEILKSKLYKIEQDKKNKEINSMKNNESINFGSQKRSYIMCPYTKVIDNDSHYEESDVIGILDGKLDGFIKTNLKDGV